MSTTPAAPAATSAAPIATAASEPFFDKGLANTVAAETQMSFIDGGKGVLEYVGIDIDSLARSSTYEETVYLLWNTKLPTQSQLNALKSALQAEYEVPDAIYDMIRQIPKDAVPMHALRTLVSALALHDPSATSSETTPAGIESAKRQALRLVAKTPTLIANFDRHRSGKSFVRPNKSFDIATNFLWMLNGEKPTDAMARGLDICLILHADHGLNASTFAGRVTIATLSDMYSAVTTAIGTLKGPLHGGANEGVIKMLKEIGSLDQVDTYVADCLAQKRKIMGIGHRVYKVLDPRAPHLKRMAQILSAKLGDPKWIQMSERIAEIMLTEKNLHANVDFYSATVYYSLGVPTDLFTPIFAIARTSGWTAHVLEQLADNRLIRPQSVYTGPVGLTVTPIAQRA